ncbi:MAG: DUF6514 family protein [Firmicutes bacterium]|nr:DUF6514 family protein [Bacillota bacterium]
MEMIMKQEIENAVIDCSGFQICYNLLHSENGCYGISCSCRKSGDSLSNYINPNLFSARSAAQKVFRLLVDNAVFPIHIPDVLSDLQIADNEQSSMAIA